MGPEVAELRLDILHVPFTMFNAQQALWEIMPADPAKNAFFIKQLIFSFTSQGREDFTCMESAAILENEVYMYQ